MALVVAENNKETVKHILVNAFRDDPRTIKKLP